MLGLICIGLIFGVATACSGSKKKEKSVKQKPLKRGSNMHDFNYLENTDLSILDFSKKDFVTHTLSSSKRNTDFDYYIQDYNNNPLTQLKNLREKTFTSSGYDEKRQVWWRRTDTWLIDE